MHAVPVYASGSVVCTVSRSCSSDSGDAPSWTIVTKSRKRAVDPYRASGCQCKENNGLTVIVSVCAMSAQSPPCLTCTATYTGTNTSASVCNDSQALSGLAVMTNYIRATNQWPNRSLERLQQDPSLHHRHRSFLECHWRLSVVNNQRPAHSAVANVASLPGVADVKSAEEG